MYVMFCYYDIRCNGTTQYGRPTHGDPQATNDDVSELHETLHSGGKVVKLFVTSQRE